jgi:DNA polymerase III delta prime subunit
MFQRETAESMKTYLQASSVLGKKVTEENIFSIASSANPEEVLDILNLALENKFIDARNKLLDTMLKHGLSGLDINKQIQKEILNLPIDGRKQLQLVAKCGEAEFRISEGSVSISNWKLSWRKLRWLSDSYIFIIFLIRNILEEYNKK